MAKPNLKTEKSEAAKIASTLMRDINRIRKTDEMQTRMNTLRKYQIKLLNDFINKLLSEGRITKEELKEYNIKKEEAKQRVFGETKK